MLKVRRVFLVVVEKESWNSECEREQHTDPSYICKTLTQHENYCEPVR